MTPDANPYAAGSAPTPASARRQLLPVAVALLVASILHMIGGLFYFAFVYSSAAAPGADPDEAHTSLVFCMYYGITMLYSGLLATGAFTMMRRSSYLWAVTVCILALVPIIGPCYVLAMPFGIWGLIVLRRAEVRDSFARF
jgi:hypothetical protein